MADAYGFEHTAGSGLVVVTGATSGIGEATAALFAQKGRPLLLLGRRQERLDALAARHSNVMAEKVDMRDLKAVEGAVTRAEQRFGPVEVFVNNAGVMFLGDVDTQSPTEWQAMIDTNIIGVLNGVRAVVGGMKGRGHGTIINVSSVAGLNPYAQHAAYCASKHAVHGLTKTLRLDLASSGVRCVLISPGMVDTELVHHVTDSDAKGMWLGKKEAVGCILQPMDIAECVLFAATRPGHVTIREIEVCPTKQND